MSAPQLSALLELVQVISSRDLRHPKALADIRHLNGGATIYLLHDHRATLINRHATSITRSRLPHVISLRTSPARLGAAKPMAYLIRSSHSITRKAKRSPSLSANEDKSERGRPASEQPYSSASRYFNASSTESALTGAWRSKPSSFVTSNVAPSRIDAAIIKLSS